MKTAIVQLCAAAAVLSSAAAQQTPQACTLKATYSDATANCFPVDQAGVSCVTGVTITANGDATKDGERTNIPVKVTSCDKTVETNVMWQKQGDIARYAMFRNDFMLNGTMYDLRVTSQSSENFAVNGTYSVNDSDDRTACDFTYMVTEGQCFGTKAAAKDSATSTVQSSAALVVSALGAAVAFFGLV